MREPADDRERQIEAAFDYRGNVTITLEGGEVLEAFLFNRDYAPHSSLKEAPFVEVFLTDGTRRRYRITEIAEVQLTGEDHARV